MALRKKTARPQRIEVPESLRPFCVTGGREQANQRPGMCSRRSVASGLAKMRRQALPTRRPGSAMPSHAARRASGIHCAPQGQCQRTGRSAATFCPAAKQPRWIELFEKTEFTRPMDFHSWRRKFVQALADMGMNAQQAQKLAGHSDLAAHERYLRTSARTLQIPSGALPI